MRARHAGARAALLAVVALAFADSSVVVLALPALLHEFGTSITAVAWVVTAYNLVLAVAAGALFRFARRFPSRELFRIGLLLFLLSSIGCGASGDLGLLIAFRSLQGLGGALVLAGSLPLAAGLGASPGQGRRAWAQATIFGAAVGPALGGALTQAFGWRAIFLVQAPVAAAAFVTMFGLAPAVEDEAEAGPTMAPRRRIAAGAGLALVSAALVGLLFLAVVMLIDVWHLRPIAAAGVVSAVPVAALLTQIAVREVGRAGAAAGLVLLAGGLAAAGFLPALSTIWLAAVLAVAGAGLGLVLPALTEVLLGGGSQSTSCALVVAIRHAGLVLGLVVLTPLFAADLSSAGNQAELRGVATVLDAPGSGGTKLKLAIDLVPALSHPPSDGVPRFAPLVASRHSAQITAIGHRLDSVVEATISRGFRRSFIAAALFALLAAPALWLAYARPARLRRERLAVALAVTAVAAFAGAEAALGAVSFGQRPRLLEPCVPHPSPAGAGAAQDQLLKQLDNLACALHTTREKLIVRVAGSSIAGRFASYLQGGIEAAAGLLKYVLGHIP